MAKRLLWLSPFLFMSFTTHSMVSPLVKNLMTCAYFTSMVWYPWTRFCATVVPDIHEGTRIKASLDNGSLRHVDVKTKNIIQEIIRNPYAQVFCKKNTKKYITMHKNLFNNNETVYISDPNNFILHAIKGENKSLLLDDFKQNVQSLRSLDSDEAKLLCYSSVTALEGKYLVAVAHTIALSMNNVEKYASVPLLLMPLALPGASTFRDLVHHRSWSPSISPLMRHSLVCLGGITLYTQLTRYGVKFIETVARQKRDRDIDRQLITADNKILLGAALWHKRNAIIAVPMAEEKAQYITTLLQERGVFEEKRPVQ